MKKLNLDQMEIIEGGSNRDCLMRGAGVAAAIGLGFYLPAFWSGGFFLLTTSSHCF